MAARFMLMWGGGCARPDCSVPRCRFPDTTRHDLTIPDDAVEVHVTVTGDVFHASSLGQQIAHSVSVEITVPGEATRTATLKSDGRTPLRLTLRYAVAGTGRTVSVRRAADPSDDERTSEEPSWSALAAGRRDTGSYGGQTRYAPRPTRRPPANSGGSAQSAARRCPGGATTPGALRKSVATPPGSSAGTRSGTPQWPIAGRHRSAGRPGRPAHRHRDPRQRGGALRRAGHGLLRYRGRHRPASASDQTPHGRAGRSERSTAGVIATV